jgi:hypothetical protein
VHVPNETTGRTGKLIFMFLFIHFICHGLLRMDAAPKKLLYFSMEEITNKNFYNTRQYNGSSTSSLLQIVKLKIHHVFDQA